MSPWVADSRAPGLAGLRAFRVAGLGALQVAGLRVESVAGLIGIRNTHASSACVGGKRLHTTYSNHPSGSHSIE